MQEDIFKKINITLVATTHPGNIGAAARAMKTMGMANLVLVSPKVFPSAEVTARATGADDVLSAVMVHEDLKDAIRDCGYVLGTTARTRNIPWPVLDPEEAAEKILEFANNGTKVAILFGRESSGLSNDEIDLCNAVISIPANEKYSSLNIAAAVQIICYEIRKCLPATARQETTVNESIPAATAGQMEQFYRHLEQCLEEINYYDPDKPRLLMRRLKRLFNRIELDENEYNILRGILTAVRENTGKEG